MKKGTTSRLFKYIYNYRLYILYIFLCALLSIAFILISPLIIGHAIDRIVGENNVDFPFILSKIGILIALFAGSSIFNWLVAAMSIKLSNKTVCDMRQDAFKKITTFPLKFIDDSKSGDILSRFLNDIEFISEGLLQATTQLFTGIVTILVTLAIMIALNFAIAIVVAVVVPLFFLIVKFIIKHTSKMFEKQQKTMGEYNEYIEEMISNQRIVTAFGYESESEEKAREINSRLYECGQKAQFYSSLNNPSIRFVNSIAYILIGLIGGFVFLSGQGLSVGIISSLLVYATQFANPFYELTGVASQLQAAFAAAERFFTIIDTPSEPSDEGLEQLQGCEGDITFKNVEFSYRPEVKLIENFNITIPYGSMVAIVGPTGAGKTTLVNLLMRFYDLNSGSILINGKNIENMTRDSIRLMFGMVLQDTWLFSGTVKENISYAAPDLTDEEIIEAAKATKAHSFIKRLEKGYETMISEDGENLSRGEKQLLTITRAMLAKSPMLILDEATSNIDPLTELKIQTALKKLMAGKTSFIIAHRLSTIQDADIILVMDKGKIVETGTHTELLKANGVYTNLYNSQFNIHAACDNSPAKG